MVESPKPTSGGDSEHENQSSKESTAKKKKTTTTNSNASNEVDRKLCKGYLFFSSRLQSEGHGPSCIGSQKDIGRAPASMKQKYQMVAAREGKLSYFKYACVGHSVYWQEKDSPTDMQDKPSLLPICVGYEIVMGKKSITSPSSAGSRVNHYKEEVFFIRRRTTDAVLKRGSLGRFTRSAEVVASGVTRNLLRAGSYIKGNLDNLFYPDSRRSK